MANQEKIAASVSDAEIEVLQQLWEQAPLSAQEIIERLQRQKAEDVHPKTIKTLINRLLKKGALDFEEKQRKYYYSPLIHREAFYAQRTSSFLNKFFNGEVAPLVSYFSQQKKLDDKDIAELKQLIEKLEDDHDK